jgi:hypothetical protein
MSATVELYEIHESGRSYAALIWWLHMNFSSDFTLSLIFLIQGCPCEAELPSLPYNTTYDEA